MSVCFEPAKIIPMSAPYTEASEGSMTVHNNTKHDIKIKVKVTESLLFAAKPNIALINAGCVQIIIFRYRPPLIDFPIKPKSQIQYIELNGIEDSNGVFEAHTDKIQQKNFRMAFPESEQKYTNIDKVINNT
ncbi:uncharacterized protein LOC143056653 [Mytilus galloprovincialis]|uniref:uncharacterized protein LOC143056653 n=1 Tax=Mytilus galloprovincialis TaxID=29158 RepID=UPI003F7CB6D7